MSQSRHAGRHFLQIPGPTNVPDRVLRAIDNPTIDHRGPEFGRMGLCGTVHKFSDAAVQFGAAIGLTDAYIKSAKLES